MENVTISGNVIYPDTINGSKYVCSDNQSSYDMYRIAQNFDGGKV